MTDCPGDNLLAAYISGVLAGDDRGAVEGHVAGCSQCASIVAAAVPDPDATPVVETQPGARIERYHILGVAGRGAVGLVYAAYDPKLDRKVALKVLRRARPELEERLHREAQAMARVSSRHVVAVHDVGAAGGGLYVAMEFVDGPTLRQWLAAQKRGWPEILRAFVQAGRGLAAAHEAGIVHRDFKPDNALVRADGSVAVTDFGLARAELDAAVPRGDGAALELTASGALLGTPAYLAPEGLRGERTDARSDLFSFCVALYEALYGAAPFQGTDLRSLVEAVTRGVVAPRRDPGVPRHVTAAILEGLRPDPASRPPSMAALLRRLERDPRHTVRSLVVVAAAAVAVAAALLVPRARGAEPLVCRGAERKLTGLWDDERKASLRSSFERSGSKLGPDNAAAVTRAFDAYGAAWVAAHVAACEGARLRGELSEAELDRRMACLDDRRARWAALARSFAAPTASDVEKAPLAAWSLPPVDACEHPGETAPPPAIAAYRPLIALARAAVARARALGELGRYGDGLRELAPALAVARSTRDRLLESEARLAEGILEFLSDAPAAEEALHAAAVAAEAIGRLDLAAEASVRLVRLLGWGQLRTGEALRVADHAEAAIERLGDRILLGDLAAARGATYARSRQPERALELHRAALAIYEAELGPDHYRVSTALNWLAIALGSSGRPAEALPSFQRAAAIRERAIGPDHPETLAVKANIGLVLRLLGRHAEAIVAQEAVLAARERALGPDHPEVAASLSNLGLVYSDVGRYADAERVQRRALAIAEREGGPESPNLMDTLGALAETLAMRGDLAGADAAAARAVAIGAQRLENDHPLVRRALQQRGLVLERAGRCREAEPILARAVALYGEGDPDAAFALDGAGRCARQLGRLRDAEAAHRRSLAVREAALGPEHPFLSDSLGGLSMVYRAMGRTAEARDTAARAVAILEKGQQSAAALADARLRLADAWWPDDRARARGEAEKALRLLDDHRDHPLRRETETWLAAHR